jgi:CTP:molybdopterin cytidylyltransferase MocA
MNIGAILLAAGYSSRMGGFKPLMQLGGRSLLGHCASLLHHTGIQTVVVVTGYRAQEVEEEAGRHGLRCIYNPDYDRGMFSSVCAGVRRITPADGFFVLPVDIPLLRPATIDRLRAAFTGQAVLYPCFNRMRGHPPLIPATLIPAILTHDGQGGLKAMLERQEDLDVAVWDHGILLDADTPEDFTVLAHRLSRLDIGERAEALALAALTLPQQGLPHGLAVAQAAERLGRELNGHGYSLDVDLLHNAALLHDVAKGRPQHEAAGAGLLRDLGLGRLAEIVVVHRDAPPPISGRLTEKEVVCLADKLIRGSKRITVRQRFQEKLDLYAGDAEACLAIRRRLANALALQTLVERITGKDIEELLDAEQRL